MKKIILTSSLAFLAVVLSLGFTKDNISSKKPATLYWFTVNTGFGANDSFTTSEVTFISGPSVTAPAGDCSPGSTYKCVIGFAASAVNTTTDQLNSGNWLPLGFGSFRGTE
jgi:hypothetical protein